MKVFSSKNNQRKTAPTADHGNCQLGSNTSLQNCLCSTNINQNTDFSLISNLTFVILTTQRQHQQDVLHISSKVLDIHDENCQNNLPYATTKRFSLSLSHTHTHKKEKNNLSYATTKSQTHTREKNNLPYVVKEQTSASVDRVTL